MAVATAKKVVHNPRPRSAHRVGGCRLDISERCRNPDLFPFREQVARDHSLTHPSVPALQWDDGSGRPPRSQRHAGDLHLLVASTPGRWSKSALLNKHLGELSSL
jgi:hypothetical protein